jgi:hypothetical protein
LYGTLDNLLCAKDVNLLGKNKHTFCGGNERGAVLVIGNEVSLEANVEVRVGRSHNKEEWVNKSFERLNILEQP